MEINNSNFALLIDAENTTADINIIPQLLDEVAKYGITNIKRIYGDWTNNLLNPWKPILLKYSIQPIQQFTYTTGKNNSDIALIIDAMDLLYNHPYLNGFCIVSSDSDFTRLATRLRESGKLVLGIGQQKTPEAFRASCDRFICTDILKPKAEPEIKPQTINNINNKIDISTDKKLTKDILTVFKSISDEEGKATLSVMRAQLDKILNDFNPRNYGFTKFSRFIEATKLFELSNRNTIIKLKNNTQNKNFSTKEQLITAFKKAANSKDIAYFSQIKANLNFDPKELGYKKFSSFIKSSQLFDLIDNNQVRLKSLNN